MLSVGKIKELIKDLPDEAVILQDDPYSEFSYDILNAEICRAKVDHTTKDGENYYESWAEENFKEFLDDNPEEAKELNSEYKPCLMLHFYE